MAKKVVLDISPFACRYCQTKRGTDELPPYHKHCKCEGHEEEDDQEAGATEGISAQVGAAGASGGILAAVGAQALLAGSVFAAAIVPVVMPCWMSQVSPIDGKYVSEPTPGSIQFPGKVFRGGPPGIPEVQSGNVKYVSETYAVRAGGAARLPGGGFETLEGEGGVLSGQIEGDSMGVVSNVKDPPSLPGSLTMIGGGNGEGFEIKRSPGAEKEKRLMAKAERAKARKARTAARASPKKTATKTVSRQPNASRQGKTARSMKTVSVASRASATEESLGRTSGGKKLPRKSFGILSKSKGNLAEAGAVRTELGMMRGEAEAARLQRFSGIMRSEGTVAKAIGAGEAAPMELSAMRRFSGIMGESGTVAKAIGAGEAAPMELSAMQRFSGIIGESGTVAKAIGAGEETAGLVAARAGMRAVGKGLLAGAARAVGGIVGGIGGFVAASIGIEIGMAIVGAIGSVLSSIGSQIDQASGGAWSGTGQGAGQQSPSPGLGDLAGNGLVQQRPNSEVKQVEGEMVEGASGAEGVEGAEGYIGYAPGEMVMQQEAEADLVLGYVNQAARGLI